MPSLPSSFVEHLSEWITAQSHQRITFAQYMDWVLYSSPGGYYSKGIGVGPQGDFVTSPHLSHDFGELLAVQLAQMWQVLGGPESFALVEMGAGQGLLAIDILRFLAQNFPDCYATVDYLIVEKSTGLRRSQRQRCQAANLDPLPRWLDWDEIPEDSLVGCCFSNELVDAFPVHRVEIQAGQLQEVYVQVQQPRGLGPTGAIDAADAADVATPFAETLGAPSTPELQAYFDALGIDLSSYPDGYRTEVNLAARDWLETVASRLRRGYCLTVDYGYSADRYYLPSRSQGTLQAYTRHRHHSDPYIKVGDQDLTAHVNFTALEQWGEALGLQKLGFTQQALFLMALGLGDRLTALASNATDLTAIQQAIQRREQLHQLMNPLGLGGFGVLLQGKGLTLAERTVALKGWSLPQP